LFRGIEGVLSTHEEIMEVFESDIAEKTKLVVAKFGPEVLYAGLHGFQIEKHPCYDIVCREPGRKRASKKIKV
jgi:hypothetical protein